MCKAIREEKRISSAGTLLLNTWAICLVELAPLSSSVGRGCSQPRASRPPGLTTAPGPHEPRRGFHSRGTSYRCHSFYPPPTSTKDVWWPRPRVRSHVDAQGWGTMWWGVSSPDLLASRPHPWTSAPGVLSVLTPPSAQRAAAPISTSGKDRTR